MGLSRAPRAGSRLTTGVVPALASAAAFGTSGTLAASLLTAGWSPGAAVTVRAGGAAAVLAVPALLQLRGRWRIVVAARWRLAAFGALGVAGCQLAYFSAVATVPVPLALLVEYSGVLGVVAWLWAVRGRRPSASTAAGAVVAMAGLALVLGVGGATLRHAAPGLAWAALAAVCLAGYFLLATSGGGDLPALATTWIALTVGALALAAAGAVGALPMTATSRRVVVGGHALPWEAPMATLVLVATGFAYATGVAAARRLGAGPASFLSLTEVLFAAVWAYLALGQHLTPQQEAGGLVVLAGVALVQWGSAGGAQGDARRPRRRD